MGCWDSFDKATPKVTINNMTLGEVQKAVKAESIWLKLAKLLAAVFCGAVSVFVCSYYLSHSNKVTEMQPYCEDIREPAETYLCKNSTLYDTQYGDGPFSDETSADEYQRLLGNCFTDCQSLGLRWSLIYKVCGFAMLGMLIQSALLAIGVFVYPLRLVGLSCQICCNCLNLGAVLMASVFRFNTKGRLAAISQAPSAFQIIDGVPQLTNERTYEDDGQLILRLWCISLFYVVAQCLLGCFAAAPPTQSKLRKWGYNLDEELVNEHGQIIQRASH